MEMGGVQLKEGDYIFGFPDGRFFDNSGQKTYARLAIMTAHVVMLKMMRVENSYFSLGLDTEISTREGECKAAWPGIEDECGQGM